MWLMERSERYQPFELLKCGLVDLEWLGVGFAAMDDPMSDSDKREPFTVFRKPGCQMVQRLIVADPFALGQARLGHDLAFGIHCLETWLAAEPFELTPKNPARFVIALGFENLEPQARRPRIEHKEDRRHASAFHSLKRRSARMREERGHGARS